MFSGYCFYVFFFFFEIFISLRIFFHFTRSMNIITGRRHWVLTEESPRLTTMDDNNMLALYAGYYTRSLFLLPAFHNDVAGIHPGLIKLNESKTPVLEFFLKCISMLSNAIRCATIFLSLHKSFHAVTSLFPTVN